MPSNTLLYPLDYSGQSQVVGEGDFDLLIQTVKTTSRDTSVRQSYNKRIAGQNAIDTQNPLLVAVNSFMPLRQVLRRAQQISTTLGTSAVIGGADLRRYSAASSFYQFLFSGESLQKLSTSLGLSRVYGASNALSGLGFFVGGLNEGYQAAELGVNSFDFKSLRFSYGQSSLSSTQNLTGSIGNKTSGFFFGGVTSSFGLSRRAVRLLYSSRALSLIGDRLAIPRASEQGASSRTNGYLAGGFALPVGQEQARWLKTSLTYTAERWAYSTELFTTLGATLSLINHWGKGTLNSELAAYFCGSIAFSGPEASGTFEDRISKLTFSGETLAPLSARLTKPKASADAVSNSVSGYLLGGNNASTTVDAVVGGLTIPAWSGSAEVERFTFSSETSILAGAQYAEPRASQGAVSDYSPGFSY